MLATGKRRLKADNYDVESKRSKAAAGFAELLRGLDVHILNQVFCFLPGDDVVFSCYCWFRVWRDPLFSDRLRPLFEGRVFRTLPFSVR